MARRSERLFPLGLYGLLLAALCWLALPRLSAPLERWVLGAATLPLRAWCLVLGREAQAASGVDFGARQLQRELLQRQEKADLRGVATVLPAGLRPVHCRVVELRRKGGAGLPAELILDRSWDDLRGCEAFVTKGAQLIGFLDRMGPEERSSDPARVLLLHHPDSRRVAASLDPGDDSVLHFVVEPAGAVDRAPLRTTLWDDPYRASRLRAAGLPVRTVALRETLAPGLPGGLLIGHSLPWGYEGSVTIDVFVEPVHDPRALTTLVLWNTEAPAGGSGLLPPLRLGSWVGAEVVELPGTGRLYAQVAAAEPVPEGSALVLGERFIGTGSGLGLGQALATPFADSRRPWALWLLPDDARADPVQVRAKVAAVDGETVWLHSGELAGAPRGFLFTGSNGRHCPAGLLLGRLGRSAAAELVAVTLPARERGLQAAFHVGPREAER